MKRPETPNYFNKSESERHDILSSYSYKLEKYCDHIEKEMDGLKDAAKEYINYMESATDEGNEYDPKEDILFYKLKTLIK